MYVEELSPIRTLSSLNSDGLDVCHSFPFSSSKIYMQYELYIGFRSGALRQCSAFSSSDYAFWGVLYINDDGSVVKIPANSSSSLLDIGSDAYSDNSDPSFFSNPD